MSSSTGHSADPAAAKSTAAGVPRPAPISAAAPISALTLDLDDTLYDNGPVLHAAEEATQRWLSRQCPRLARRYGAADLRALRRRLAGEHPHLAHDYSALRRLALAEAARETGYPADIAEQAFAVFYAARQRVTFFSDVVPALEALSTRFPLAAVTNGNANVVELGLGRFFRFALTPGEAGAAKPSPVIFREAVRRLEVPAGEVLHVGDDPAADVEGARTAGLRTAWVNRGGKPWSGAAPPDYQVRCLNELARSI